MGICGNRVIDQNDEVCPEVSVVLWGDLLKLGDGIDDTVFVP